MKKILLPILLLAPVALMAQPTLTYKSHGLRANENHAMQEVQYVSPGTTGAQQVWDYRTATPIAEGRNEKIEATNSSNHFLIVTEAGAKFNYACNERANVYEGSESSGRSVRFDQPITKVRYPFTYGSSLEGLFNGTTSYGATSAGTIAGSFSSYGDAYGTLLLPNNVKLNNVLRVKTTESYVEQMCSHVTIETVKYLWYAAEYRYPVFVTWEITYTYPDGKTHSSNQSFYTMAKLESSTEEPAVIADETPVPAKVKPVEYSVYPNPYSDYFHLTYTLEKETLVDIALYTNNGQLVNYLVKNQKQAAGVYPIMHNQNIADISGFYFLRLTFDGKTYTQPLINKK